MKDRFRKMREALGYSQEEMTDALELRSDTSKKSNTVSKWETGASQPSADVFKKLASADFHRKTGKKVNLNWLLTSEGEMFLMEEEKAAEETPDSVEERLSRIQEFISRVEEDIQKIAYITPPKNVIPFPRHPRPWNPDVCLQSAVGAGEVCLVGDDAYSEGYVSVELPDQVDWVLKVKGTSMEKEIADGALLFVRPLKLGEPKEGEIYTCYLPEEKIAVVRRIFFHEKGGHVEIGLQKNSPKETRWYTFDEEIVKINAKVIDWTKTVEERDEILARVIKRE